MKRLIVIAVMFGTIFILADEASSASVPIDAGREEFVQEGAKILATEHVLQSVLCVMDMYLEEAQKELEKLKDLAKNDPILLDREILVMEMKVKVSSYRLRLVGVMQADISWQVKLMDRYPDVDERDKVVDETETVASDIYNNYLGQLVKHWPNFMIEFREAKKAAAKRKQ